jgi:hypothetical protein
VTHHRIKVLEDGTRVYSNGTRYKPLSQEQRKYGVRKPDDPEAQRYHGQWFLPLDLLPDEVRYKMETRPDTDAYDHMSKPRPCKCDVCRRPEAQRWKDRWRRDQMGMASSAISSS